MRHSMKITGRAAVCRIMAASLVISMAASGSAAAEDTSDLPDLAVYETESETGMQFETEIDAAQKAEEDLAEHRAQQIVISDADDLEALAQRCRVDTDSRDFEVILDNDISLIGRSFSAIPYFSGVFDGQGYTIRELMIHSDGSQQGLVRHVGEGAVIRNLSVEGAIEPGADAVSVGGIAGENAGSILNCSFRGKVRAKEDAGGIAGINTGSGLISSCVSEGDVVAQHRAGGIAGQNSGSIITSTNLGKVNNEPMETAAQTKSTLTSNLSNLTSFDVSSISQEDYIDVLDIGGIAGYSDGMLSECKNSGTVGYARTGYNVGGIAGRSQGFTVACTNEGQVTGRKDVGGILGQLEPESIWEDSKSRVQQLETQLNQLNSLIDTLAYDVSDSTGTIKDDIATAAEYADNTILDLQTITDDVSGDIEGASSTLASAIEQLQAAVDEEDAAALRTALSDLAAEVAATDFLHLPVNVTVKEDKQTDLSTLLDERETQWWQKLDRYLDSREQRSGQRLLPTGQNPSGGSTDSQSADPPALLGGDEGGDSDYTGDDSQYAGLFGDDTSAAAADDGFTDGGEDEVWYDDAGEDADFTIVSDDEADLVLEDSTMTGSEDAVIEDEGGSPEDVIEDAGDEGNILNIDSQRSQEISVGDEASASHSSNVHVDVDANRPDTTQLRSLLQTILTDFSSMLDPTAVSNAMEILKGLELTPPDTTSFYSNLQALADSIVPIAGDASALTGKVAEDVDAITDQLDQILGTFFDLAGSISLDDQYVESDISEQDPYQSDTSSIESCKNTGTVSADTNAGGIAGCIGFENKIDAEGVLDVSKYLLKDARYTIFAAERGCYNSGPVTAKKEAAGGITGSMEFGIITDSVNTGAITVEEGGYCGGICGTSQGAVTKSCAGGLMNAETYTGGIAGKGTDIADCISYGFIDGGTSYQGAIAGYADGTVSGCRYVDYGIGGIDNVGYTGVAQPLEHVEKQAGNVTVTFLVDDEVYEEVQVHFGGSLDKLPEVPNRGNDYWVWDDFDKDQILRSQTVSGSYHRAIPTLASDGDVPDYLVEGIFYEGQELTVSDLVLDESPVSTESLADLIGEIHDDIHGTGGTEMEETQGSSAETEPEDTASGIGHARQELKRIMADRLTGPLLDAKTLKVNDYDEELTVRVKAASGGRLFTSAKDGDLTETEYTQDGSYIVFKLANGGSFAYYESISQNKSSRMKLVVMCIVAAAILLALILLIRRIRKKRKAKKAAKAEKTGKAEKAVETEKSEQSGKTEDSDTI